MPKPEIAQSGHFQYLRLKRIEIDFCDRRPRYPIKIKVTQNSQNTEPTSKEFEEDGVRGEEKALLNWDTDIHLSSTVDLEIVIKESHTMRFLSKKDFASVLFRAKETGGEDTIVKEDEETKTCITLTFARPSTFGHVMRKEASKAEILLDKKIPPLQRLGRARQFIDAAGYFARYVAEIHPIARAAVIAFDKLYETLQEQEEIHADAVELLEELQTFLLFTELVDPEKVSSEAARDAIRDFLNLFKETCEIVVKYSSSGIIGNLLSSHGPKIGSLEKNFRKVKSRYDWAIRTDIWRAALKLEKYHDDEMLKLLQISLSGPAGKEYYRSDKCCLPGTRSELLEQILRWADTDSESRLFWLHGIAGSGKSAIANSIAHGFEEQRLLAGCFFCKRDDPDLRNSDKVIPSLAFHLSSWHEPYSRKLVKILRAEKHKLASKTVQEQFELLIKRPVLELPSDEQIRSPRPLIIVIDALDECGVTKGQRCHLAQVLIQVSQLVPWLKLVVTSRPLPELVQAFRGVGDTVTRLHLNEAGDPTADVMRYTKYRAELIAKDLNLESSWLSEEQIVALARKAHGLFIWTSTVFSFIEAQLDLDHAVAVVFSSSPDQEGENPEDYLDNVYRMVLQEAGKGGPHNMLLVKTVVGVIFRTARNAPLPVDAVTRLIPHLDQNVVGRVIDQLQAVLYKDAELDNAIRVCHPSFIDFMGLETRSGEFWAPPSDIDFNLASRCLEIMKEGLSFNICQIEMSYHANKDIPDLQNRIATEISRALGYSCLYWMTHVQGVDASKKGHLSELIDGVLCTDTAIYWIEVLSLLGELKKGVQILSQASTILSAPDLKVMAFDLFRFVSAFHDAIATSAPHLYLSALSWLPTKCLLARRIATKFIDQSPIREGKSEHWPNTLLNMQESSLVRAVAYSRDGRFIAAGLQDGNVCIRDAQTGNLLGPLLRGLAGMITSVAFSPDGTLIAASAHENAIQVWDVETGVPTLDAIKLEASPTSIAFIPEGKLLVSGSDNGTIHIWDVETGKLFKDPIKGPNGAIRAIAVSPDGRYIASGTELKTIQVWDAESGTPVGKPIEGHGNWVSALAFSPDGKNLVSGSLDKTIRVWDPATGELLYGPFTGHTDYVYSVAISSRGDLIASGSRDMTIRVWDVKTGKPLGQPLRGHTERVTGVAFSPDSRYIVSGSHDMSTRIWDIETRCNSAELLKGQVISIAFPRDGKRVACGTTEKVIQLWDVETGEAIGKPFEGHNRWVNAIAFSKDGRYIVSGSDDATIRIWDVETQTSIGEPLKGHTGWVKAVAFSEDDRTIISGSQDKTVRIWDVETRKQIGEPLEGHNDWVNAIALSPDRRHVASGADDSIILIWDMETRQLVGEPLAGHGAHTFSVAYSLDGKYIAAGFQDGTIRIWNIESDTRILVFDYTGTSGAIRSVAFAPTGTRLVTGSENGLIETWDAQRGEAAGEPLAGHTGRVFCVACSYDDALIASGSEDGTIRLWETTRRPSAGVLDGLPPSSVPEDGWIRTSDGQLLMWVPLECRNGVRDMCSLCIPSDALGHLVRVDWSKLCHGVS